MSRLHVRDPRRLVNARLRLGHRDTAVYGAVKSPSVIGASRKQEAEYCPGFSLRQDLKGHSMSTVSKQVVGAGAHSVQGHGLRSNAPIPPLRPRCKSAKVPPCHRSPEKSQTRSSHSTKDLASRSGLCSARRPRSDFQMFRRRCNLATAACTSFKKMRMGWKSAWRASCARLHAPRTVFISKLPKTPIRRGFQPGSATRKPTISITQGASSAGTASKHAQQTPLRTATAFSLPPLTSTPSSLGKRIL